MYAAQIILPGAFWKCPIGGEARQFFCVHVKRIAVGYCHMRKLADEGESDSAQDRFLETGSDHCVAVGPHQDRRAVFKGGCECHTAFDGTDESHCRVYGRSHDRQKPGVYV